MVKDSKMHALWCVGIISPHPEVIYLPIKFDIFFL
jgi:hypothetical protein